VERRQCHVHTMEIPPEVILEGGHLTVLTPIFPVIVLAVSNSIVPLHTSAVADC